MGSETIRAERGRMGQNCFGKRGCRNRLRGLRRIFPISATDEQWKTISDKMRTLCRVQICPVNRCTTCHQVLMWRFYISARAWRHSGLPRLGGHEWASGVVPIRRSSQITAKVGDRKPGPIMFQVQCSATDIVRPGIGDAPGTVYKPSYGRRCPRSGGSAKTPSP